MLKISSTILLILVLPCVAVSEDSSIGYPTVDTALVDLKSNPDASIRTQEGWTIISIKTEEEATLWSFTPAEHPAHPAAVKRTVFEKDGGVYIDMNALCEAKKNDCDALMEQFKKLNQNIIDNLKK